MNETTRASFTATAAFPPFEYLPGPLDAGVLLICDHVICDHASNALPPEYGSLGLPSAAFARHIAYDIGAQPTSHAR